jgi:hypothetical protein
VVCENVLTFPGLLHLHFSESDYDAHVVSDQTGFATSIITGLDNGMNEDMLEEFRAQVRAHIVADKVTEDRRLKAEILLLRNHATIAEDKTGRLVCEGAYGRGVADQKEATLFEMITHKPLRWQIYKSHLFAVHSALCWSVLGISIG